MIISKNSQLGLRFEDREVKVSYLQLVRDRMEKDMNLLQKGMEQIKQDEDFVKRALADSNGSISLPDDLLERANMGQCIL